MDWKIKKNEDGYELELEDKIISFIEMNIVRDGKIAEFIADREPPLIMDAKKVPPEIRAMEDELNKDEFPPKVPPKCPEQPPDSLLSD